MRVIGGSWRGTVRIALATLGALALVPAAGAARAGAAPPGDALRDLAVPAIASGFVDTVAFSGLTNPMNIRFASDGRIFVAEKRGRILVFDSMTDTTPTVFADLSTNVDDYWDRGLMSIALDPNFPQTPYVYALYAYDAVPGGTAPRWNDACPTPPGPNTDGCAITGRLVRLQAAGNQMTGGEQVLLGGWCQQFPSHSVGDLQFGIDGALYVSGGDGASFTFADYGQAGGSLSGTPTPKNPCGDPPGGVGGSMTPPTARGGTLRSQSIRRPAGEPVLLNGTVLRVDPATGNALPTNPLFSSTDPNARRIVAAGLRNPFRMAFRPGTTDLWLGDVGWDSWEEIDRIANPTSGMLNFGWPCYEGNGRMSAYDALDLSMCETLYGTPSATTGPYYTYSHAANVVANDGCPTGGSSSTGVAFYNGGSYGSAYNAALFFADYTRRCLWVMFAGSNGLPNPGNIKLIQSGIGAVDLEIGPGGDLFYADLDGGSIHRISSTNAAPVAVATANPTYGPVPLTVNFDGRGSSAPSGHALAYAWDLDGDSAFDDSTSATPSRTYTTAGSVQVRLRVTDTVTTLSDTTAPIVIGPGNTPPTATISQPTSALTWAVGDPIPFSGSATDAEDGTLAASRLTWRLIVHHCAADGVTCHTHVAETRSGVASGSFTAPDHEYPSWLEVELTAADSFGLTDVESVRLDPKTVDLTFVSNPPGLQLGVGSVVKTAPFTQTVIKGGTSAISAPSPQSQGGTTYGFASWSDGGAQTHSVVTNASATYTATYVGDLALGRPTSASSSESATLGPEKAVDGNSTTRWSSLFADNQWWRVDLGSVKKVDTVSLNWEAAYASSYKIQVSSDGTTFADAATVSNTAAGWKTTAFAAVDARYVRVLGVTRATPYGISFWDAVVTGPSGSGPPPSAPVNTAPPVVSGYAGQGQILSATTGTWTNSPTSFAYRWRRCDSGGGSCVDIAGATAATYTVVAADVDATLVAAVTATNGGGSTTANSAATAGVRADKALGKTASASSSESATTTPDKAVDGDPATRWSSSFADNQWWRVDLGSVRKVDAVALNWEAAYASSYKIQLSSDGTTFTDAATVSLAQAGWKLTTFAAADTRYVRVLGVTRATPYGISFFDAQVFGPADSGPPPPPPANTAVPVVAGYAGQGQTLSTTNGAWTNSPTSYAYEWRRCDSAGSGCVAIASAASASYKLVAADIGSTIVAAVTATNAGGSATAASAATAVVRADKALGKTTIASSTESATLTSDKAVDGDSATRWSSTATDTQWWRVDLGALRAIDTVSLNWHSAYASSYRIQVSSDGTAFTDAATVSLAQEGWKTTTFTSVDARYVRVLGVTRATAGGISFWDAQVFGGTDPTGPPTVPVNTAPPVVSGYAGRGQTLLTSNGAWSNSPSSFTYRWRRCDSGGGSCVDISGATSARYLVQAADIGATLVAAVTATNGSGSATAPSAATGVVYADKALGKTASASSSESATLGPEKAVDGDSATRWSSSFANNQWWRVDLGSVKKVEAVALNWEAAFASSYKIQVSTDGTTFADAATVSLAQAGWQVTAFAAADARYVRVLGVTRATPYGISFWDAQVFGPADSGAPPPPAPVNTAPPAVSGYPGNGQTLSTTNGTWSNSPTAYAYQWRRCDASGGACADIANATDASYTLVTADVGSTIVAAVTATNAGGSATAASAAGQIVRGDKAAGQPTSASSSESATLTPDKAVDSNSATRWSSLFADNQWWQVDLGSPRTVDAVALNWEPAYASSYKIQVSSDGTTFTDVATVSNGAAGWKLTTFTAVSARYVRVLGVTRATPYGISFWDANVFGPGA